MKQHARAAIAAAVSIGPLRGLVNCAGIATGEKTVGKDGPHALATFARVIGINLIGTFNMIRVAADAMAKTGARQRDGERGVLINTASVAAYDGQIGQAAYAASKGGVVGMTLPIARDLARRASACMTIAPGFFGNADAASACRRKCRMRSADSLPFPVAPGHARRVRARSRSTSSRTCMLNGETIRLDGAIRLPPK